MTTGWVWKIFLQRKGSIYANCKKKEAVTIQDKVDTAVISHTITGTEQDWQVWLFQNLEEAWILEEGWGLRQGVKIDCPQSRRLKIKSVKKELSEVILTVNGQNEPNG